MMPEEDARCEAACPPQLAVDNRMVVPVGVPIRIQTTGADVIHSFAVPSLWFKLDAVPGPPQRKDATIEEPGIYYGQCSELCGARHGYMPIAVEARAAGRSSTPGCCRRAARRRRECSRGRCRGSCRRDRGRWTAFAAAGERR